MSLERLRIIVSTQRLSALKSMREHIKQYKWEHGKYFDDNKIRDIEQRETIIDGAIIGLVNMNDIGNMQDFAAWDKKINFKKRVF
jgi:hypothetical protein